MASLIIVYLSTCIGLIIAYIIIFIIEIIEDCFSEIKRRRLIEELKLLPKSDLGQYLFLHRDSDNSD